MLTVNFDSGRRNSTLRDRPTVPLHVHNRSAPHAGGRGRRLHPHGRPRVRPPPVPPVRQVLSRRHHPQLHGRLRLRRHDLPEGPGPAGQRGPAHLQPDVQAAVQQAQAHGGRLDRPHGQPVAVLSQAGGHEVGRRGDEQQEPVDKGRKGEGKGCLK